MPEFNFSAFQKSAPFNGLTDRIDDIICWYDRDVFFIIDWIESSFTVKRRQTSLEDDIFY